MSSEPIEQCPFEGAGRFFTNEFVQLGERVTFEWTPTVERRSWGALALIACIFDAMVIVASIFEGAPPSPLLALVLLAAPLMAWIAASATKLTVHVSDRGLTVDRFGRLPRTHRFDDVERIEVDERGRPMLRMISGELIDPKLRLPRGAQDVVLEEVRRRLVARTVPTYRVAPEPLVSLRVEEPASLGAPEDRPIAGRNHLPRPPVSA